MDYNNFRFEAVVDFVEVRVTLREPSHVSHIRRLTGLERVLPVNEGAGGATAIFDLCIYDPDSYDDVRAVLARLESGRALAFTPVVARLEVALDAYPKRPDEHATLSLADFVVGLTNQHQYPAGERRIYDKKFREQPFHRNSAVRLVSEGCVVGIGNRDAGHFQRAYYKTTDKSGKTKLAPQCCRVRFENNYSGKALPVVDLSELLSFRFESLARTGFSFRLLADDHDNHAIKAAEQGYALPVGKLHPRRSKAPNGKAVWRKSGRLTRANTELNEKARQALRNLTMRWAKTTESGPTLNRDSTEKRPLRTSFTFIGGGGVSNFSVDSRAVSVGAIGNSEHRPSNLLSTPLPETYSPPRKWPSSRFIPLERKRLPEGLCEKFFPFHGFQTFNGKVLLQRLKGFKLVSIVQKLVARFQAFKWGSEGLGVKKGICHPPGWPPYCRFPLLTGPRVTSSTFGKRLSMSEGSTKASTVSLRFLTSFLSQ